MPKKLRNKDLCFWFQFKLILHTFFCFVFFVFLETIGIKREGLTQEIVPDNTLGDENTIITLPNNSDNITVMGGAIRDTVLFHSFQEFNINDTEQVYFSNPDGIFNILTRVTGENSSQILGTLGVNGDANFFLINPNGIYFGENAQLDLRGSFTATTADSIFIDHFEFSATHPEPPPPLLTINVEPGIQYGMNHRDREIQNHGHLQVDPGNHLNLLGGSIFNTGSLTALGGKIEILGTKINISENSQIDVSAPLEGGIILIGGDERRRGNLPTADRVYIGEDVSIRANAIGAIGDGGQVIIWAEEITGFYGEIEARGGFHFGNGGFVEVSGKEYLIFSGFVDVSAPNGYNGIILLDPRNMIISNDPNSLSILTGNEILADDFFDTNIKILASSLEMLSGDIILEATENIIIEPGVNLNFNFPDSISFRADADRNGSGDFLMGANNTIFTRGGEIEIRGNNLMIGSLDTSDVTDEGGSISLLAAGDIDLQSLRSNSFLEDAGEIEVISEGGSIAIFETIHAGSSLDRGAPVYLEAAENIRIGIFNNPFEPAIDTRGFEGGGDITVISQNDTVSLANSDLMSGTLEGDAGDITIVGNSLEIVDSMITSEITLDGKVGTISLEGNESILLNGSLLMTDMAFGAVGMPGNILMNAQQVTLDDSIAIALSGGTEKSGNIEIAATALTLQNDSVLEVFSWREGGNLNITATDLSLNRSQVKTESNGINGGNISINIDNLTMRNNSLIFTAVRSPEGTGGNIEINASGFLTAVLAENSDIFTRGEQGRRGELTIAAQAILGFNIGEELTEESDILGTVEVVFEKLDELDDLDEFDEEFDDDDSRRPLELQQPREEFVQQCGSARQNELAIAGRHGLRTNPSQILRGREIWQDRRDFSTPQNSAIVEEADISASRETRAPLVEARGWKINERGNIELIGEQLSTNHYQCTLNNDR